ncbi:MAG: subclass B3 metallo-beta-lactamase [Bryobacteraceae bacterium]
MPRLIGLLFLIPVLVAGQNNSSTRARWNQPMEPFRIAGNIYYVGTLNLGSYLITTPQGDFLLDGGLPESAPLIEKSITKLGFHLTDVKILLNSHAHFDHAGGLAALKRDTGAQLIASRADGEMISQGRQVYFDLDPDTKFPPAKVDRFIDDGGTEQLGGTTLTAHLTPGHSLGCTTWTMPVVESGKTYNVVFLCSTTFSGFHFLNNPKNTHLIEDFNGTFAKLHQLPCDIFLAPHGELFHLSEKRARMRAGGPNPFIDPTEFAAYVNASEQDFRREVARQQSAAAAHK